MEGELGQSELARKLLESRHRFQKRMQLLIEKYNQPFEDAPVVQMATLTYQTPQGLRLWGGGVIQEPGRGHEQADESSVTPVSWVDSPGRAAGSNSSDVIATLDHGDTVTVMPVVPQSPLKNELRRKYLTQVDVLLQEQRCSEHADDGDREDTRMTPIHSLARPANGDCSDVSTEKPTSPVKSAAAHRACEPSASLAVVPRNDGLLSRGAGGHSLLWSSSCEAADVGDVTISDLYEGMLHSMSRLLRAKPSCVISTKTLIVQNWHCKRRPRRKSRLNRTYYKGARHGERCAPYAKPVREAGPLSEPSNHTVGSPLKEALRDVNSPRACELIPSWKELKVTPQKCSSLVRLDPGATYDLDQENRFRTLTCYASPVKNVSRFTALRGLVGNRHQEIEVKFDKLYREYCPVLSSQRCPPGSWAVDVHKGHPTGPGCLQASETHRPSGAVPRRLLERLEKPGETALEVAGCLSKHGSSSLLSKSDLVQKWTLGSLLQRSSPGRFKKSLLPTEAVSEPSPQPPDCEGDRYRDIKEQFDRLHQECLQRSPQQTQGPSCTGQSPGGRGKLTTGSAFQSPQKSCSSLQWSRRSPLGSVTVDTHISSWHPHLSAKRCRLSDPKVCGQWAMSRTRAAVDRAISRPGEEIRPLQLDLEKKERRTQNGREK